MSHRLCLSCGVELSVREVIILNLPYIAQDQSWRVRHLSVHRSAFFCAMEAHKCRNWSSWLGCIVHRTSTTFSSWKSGCRRLGAWHQSRIDVAKSPSISRFPRLIGIVGECHHTLKQAEFKVTGCLSCVTRVRAAHHVGTRERMTGSPFHIGLRGLLTASAPTGHNHFYTIFGHFRRCFMRVAVNGSLSQNWPIHAERL